MQEFNDDVLKNKGLVLVDFWAPWCRYCVLLEPVLENLKNKFNKDFSIFKVNVDKFPELAQEYDVMALPTIKFFKNGKELNIEVMDRSFTGLSEIISKNI